MKMLVIADDDGFVKSLTDERADVVVSCGDLLDQTIIRVASVSQCQRVFAVKGNHDGSGLFPPPIFDLHLRTEVFGGIRFGGFHGSWRYKPRGHFLYEQSEVEHLLASFAPVDVFVAHNSPRHIHDRDDEVHVGFDAFTSYIPRIQPQLFIHGHQHENQETYLGRTRIVGVFGLRRLDLELHAIA
jgi:Icc-related predicted phosphoesterase